MKSLNLFFGILFLIGVCSIPNTYAQTSNKKISIQGFLKDGNGKAVDDGNYDLIFKLYSVASGGTPIWTENHDNMRVYGGIYTVYLGETERIDRLPWDVPYFLGVTVNGTELSPRTELTYAPYALAVNKTRYVECSGAVGDVKYSILNPTQFAAVNGDCWVPMDGRSIVGSELAGIIGSNTLTNAGGLFIRSQEFSNSTNYDSDRTSSSPIASFQSDVVRSHNHTFSATTTTDGSHNHTHNANGDIGDNPNNNGLAFANGGKVYTGGLADGTTLKRINLEYARNLILQPNGNHTHGVSGTTANTGASETRPANINLWVYIRIN